MPHATRRGYIFAALPSRAHVILLAIEGKERSSEELSARLDDLMLRGSSDIASVIGGLDKEDEVRARADEMLSFGRITLPHNLARVVLLEQIYRACKISRGEPYHEQVGNTKQWRGTIPFVLRNVSERTMRYEDWICRFWQYGERYGRWLDRCRSRGHVRLRGSLRRTG